MTAIQAPSTRLTGRRLVILRILWVGGALLASFLYLASLFQLGKTSVPPAGTATVTDLILGGYYLGMALFLFWQRADDWVVFILSLSLMLFLTTDHVQETFGFVPLAARIDLLLQALSSTLMPAWFYIFPDGRFVPRWTRWAVLAMLAVQSWRIFDEEAYMANGFALVGLLFITVPISLIYRYFRVANPTQRQQIKWVVIAIALTVPGIVVGLVTYSFAGELGNQIGSFIWFAFLILFPLSVTVSVLRYRLWDIDLIIRKTLVYSAVTLLLGLVYAGAVILLQGLAGALIDEQSPLVIVVSTLLVAALFAPVRRRVQAVVDRRFFRQKYNAVQVLEQFALRARDEVELEALTGEVLRIIEETMRPERVTLWIAEPKRR